MLKTKVCGQAIRVDLALLSVVTHIPISLAYGIPFPDSMDLPSIEDFEVVV
jgi:hypothetical protein